VCSALDILLQFAIAAFNDAMKFGRLLILMLAVQLRNGKIIQMNILATDIG